MFEHEKVRKKIAFLAILCVVLAARWLVPKMVKNGHKSSFVY
jgi:hypothetical protein